MKARIVFMFCLLITSLAMAEDEHAWQAELGPEAQKYIQSITHDPNSLDTIVEANATNANKESSKEKEIIIKPVTPVTTSPVQSGSRIWNLQDADILSVINEVSQETGKNFVVDPRVSGKITLISSKPIQQKQVYQLFLSVLGMLGFSAIPSGDVIKIIPNMESGENGARVATHYAPGKGDEIVVRIVPLQNVSATQLIPVIRPMLPQWSNISAYSPGNIIVLLGRANNLQHVVNLIHDVDKTANNKIQLIKLNHASAAQVVSVLNNLQSASRALGDIPTVSIAVDERSNSILLSGAKTQRLRMRVLISQLDQPSTNTGNTEVIYLKYLQAKTFAPLLGKIAQNIQGKDSGGGGGSLDTSAMLSSIRGAQNKQSGNADKEPIINSGTIQAEPNSNAIIITAPVALMRALKTVISKLDIRPAEVLVEAIIAEVDESNLTSLGIQWGSVTADGTGGGGESITSFPPLGAGVFGIMPSVQIRAVLTMLRNQNGVDILSTPHIMVLDNQKATIEIGQDVPFQSGSYATSNSATTVTPFTTNQYKPVTLKLSVTPQINLGRSIRLKFDLKNDTLQNPQNPGITPIINTSKIKNSVLVNSSDVLVIGGLTQRANNENVNKVPILGDLPIFGPLFQQKISNQQKKNLIVFLKPIIVPNSEDANVISYYKYNTIRVAQGNFHDDLNQIGDTAVSTALPPWRNSRNLPKPFDCERP